MKELKELLKQYRILVNSLDLEIIKNEYENYNDDEYLIMDTSEDNLEAIEALKKIKKLERKMEEIKNV